MEKIAIDWNKHLGPLNCEFECDLKDKIYKKEGFKVDGQGKKGFINKIKSCFANKTPSSCDYFYHTHSKKTQREIFCCLEFSDLNAQYQRCSTHQSDMLDRSIPTPNEQDKSCDGEGLEAHIKEIIATENQKKANSTAQILQILYDPMKIKLENFPSQELPKYFLIIRNLSSKDEVARFSDHICSKIQLSFKQPFYRDILLMNIKEFYENYCQ